MEGAFLADNFRAAFLTEDVAPLFLADVVFELAPPDDRRPLAWAASSPPAAATVAPAFMATPGAVSATFFATPGALSATFFATPGALSATFFATPGALSATFFATPGALSATFFATA